MYIIQHRFTMNKIMNACLTKGKVIFIFLVNLKLKQVQYTNYVD